MTSQVEPGRDSAAVQAAIDLSTSKYCAAQAMLRHTASFVTTFEVVPEKTVPAAA